MYTITGAAGGIGLDIAIRLAARGALLSLADVKSDELQAVERAIAERYPSCKVIAETVDIRKREQVDAWIAKTIALFGHIDGCVNSAGKESSPCWNHVTWTVPGLFEKSLSWY